MAFTLITLTLTLAATAPHAHAETPAEKEAKLKSMLQSTFIDFDYPAYMATKALLLDIFQDSKLGPVPSRVAQMKEFLSTVLSGKPLVGGTPPPSLPLEDRKRIETFAANLETLYPKPSKNEDLLNTLQNLPEQMSSPFTGTLDPNQRPMIQTGTFKIIDKNGNEKTFSLDELNRDSKNRPSNAGSIKSGTL